MNQCIKTLQCLIDRPDVVEIVRDKIAQILTVERENQKALALEKGKNPNDWDFDVSIDRSNPFEKWLLNQKERTPIINVWFETGSYNKTASNTVEKQKFEAQFNIDCYGFGMAQDIAGGGHLLGDQKAATEAHRAMRLVRNILMAGENTYLQMRGVVWGRWPVSQTLFQPRFDNNSGLQVMGARIILNVEFFEFSQQYVGPEIEQLNVCIERDDDGFIYAETQFDY